MYSSTVGTILAPFQDFRSGLQAAVPDGDQRQHLELAKLHIDLLGVLKDKTAGNVRYMLIGT